MIPTKEEFEKWEKPRWCAACHQPLTWPCSSIPFPGGAVNFHLACGHPLRDLILDEILRMKGEHPDQIKGTQEFRFKHGQTK